MTRTQRSVWSYLTGLALSAGTVAVGFVATPFLLRFLGAERFGAFRVACDWAGYLSLLELGLGGALVPLLARAVATGREAVRETTATGVAAYTRVTLAMLAGGVALALAVGWLIPVSPGALADLRRGCWVGLLVTLFVPLSPLRTLVEAGQRGYLVNSLRLLQSVVITGVSLLLAWVGWGVTGQYAALVAGSVAFYGVLVWDTRRRQPGLLGHLATRRGAGTYRRELWKLNWPTLLFESCGRVSLLTDNIVIAAMLGAPFVVPFFLTQRLAALAVAQLQGIGGASWAALAELYRTGQQALFNRRLVELTNLTATLGLACMVPVAAYNHEFIRLWLGSAQDAGPGVTLLAALNGVLLGILAVWGWAFSATGQVSRLVPVMLVSAALNLALSVACTRAFGLVGPLLGTTVAFLGVNSWWTPRLLHRWFGTSRGLLAAAVARPFALALPYGAALYGWAHAHRAAGWVGLAAEMAAGCVVYLALYWFVAMDGAARNAFVTRLRLVVGRRAGVPTGARAA